MQNETTYQPDKEIYSLLKKIIAGIDLSPSEQTMLDDWKAQSPARHQLLYELNQQATLPEAMARMMAIEQNETNNLNAFLDIVRPAETRRVPAIRRWLAAASILLILSVAAYFWFS